MLHSKMPRKWQDGVQCVTWCPEPVLFFSLSFFNVYFVVSFCHILHVPSLMFNPKKANSFIIMSCSASRMYKHLAFDKLRPDWSDKWCFGGRGSAFCYILTKVQHEWVLSITFFLMPCFDNINSVNFTSNSKNIYKVDHLLGQFTSKKRNKHESKQCKEHNHLLFQFR